DRSYRKLLLYVCSQGVRVRECQTWIDQCQPGFFGYGGGMESCWQRRPVYVTISRRSDPRHLFRLFYPGEAVGISWIPGDHGGMPWVIGYRGVYDQEPRERSKHSKSDGRVIRAPGLPAFQRL